MKSCKFIIFSFIFNIVFLFSEFVQISWEATPGRSSGFLNYLNSAEYPEQKKYLDAIFLALDTNSDGPGDIISKMIGINVTGIISGYSAWEGKVGAGAQTIAQAEIIDDSISQKQFINQYASILGYLLRQDAVIWYYKGNKTNESNLNGIEAIFNSNLNFNEFNKVYQEFYLKFKTWNLAPGYTNKGFIVLNYEENITNKNFQKGAKNILKKLRLLGIGDGFKKANKFQSKGEYISNNWKEFPEGDSYLKIVQDEKLRKWAMEFRKTSIDVVNDKFIKKISMEI